MHNLLRSSKATLTKCTFGGNSAQHGGGMRNFSSSAELTECTFSGNSADLWGGGMCNQWSSRLTLTNCVFSRNSADDGGGMSNSDSIATLTNCVFSGNSADYGGGGMCNYQYSWPTLTECTFSGNSADYGGGMCNEYGSIGTLTNCTLSANCAGHYGGGMANNDSRSTVTNCTFAQNSAENGNALACDDLGSWRPGPSNVELINCILWDDGDEIWNNDNSTIVITYSNVQGGWPGQGNIGVDPLFADIGYWDPNETPEDPNDDFWVDGDYHLKSEAGRWDPNSETWVQDDVTSACIDAGDPNVCAWDEPHPSACIINMGAYGGSAEASKSLALIPECFPPSYSTYDDWIALGTPCCWCWQYQCDGDTDCGTETFYGYRTYGKDLTLVVENWKRRIDDPLLDPCADIDHTYETFFKYRVYGKDLAKIVDNWKKRDADLAGDCPRPE